MVVTDNNSLGGAKFLDNVKHSAVKFRTSDRFVHFAVKNFSLACRNIITVFIKLHDFFVFTKSNVHCHYGLKFTVFVFKVKYGFPVPVNLVFFQKVVAFKLGRRTVFDIVRRACIPARIKHYNALLNRGWRGKNIDEKIAVTEKRRVSEF